MLPQRKSPRGGGLWWNKKSPREVGEPLRMAGGEGEWLVAPDFYRRGNSFTTIEAPPDSNGGYSTDRGVTYRDSYSLVLSVQPGASMVALVFPGSLPEFVCHDGVGMAFRLQPELLRQDSK